MSQRAPFYQREMISLCGRAAHGWSMLQDGDQVLVGLSGGKDSLSLLWLLHERRRRIPIDFSLHAAHIEMGFHAVDHQALAEFCAGLEIPFTVLETDFGPRAHTAENREKSACFFCAMHRRRELFQLAGRLGCRKLALAHHQDDIIETFMMNLFHAGSLSTMLPVQEFFQGAITVIRPLALINATQTARFCKRMELPVQPPCCPSASQGARAEVRRMLEPFYRRNAKVRPSIWSAISHPDAAVLPSPPRDERHARRPRSGPAHRPDPE